MAAGMVMPLAHLRAIYELLFKDGAIVVKKDKRPTSIHPDIEGVSNLKVLRAMASLKSRGYIRETFVWKHAYYYLTNEGIVYLRDYLHLPLEIIPATLQRVRPPASSAPLQDRKVDISKPQSERKTREGVLERHVYRHKRDESDRCPRNFRDSFQCKVGPTAVQNSTDSEELWAKEDHVNSLGASSFPTEDRSTRCLHSVKKAKKTTSPLPHSSSVVQKNRKEMQIDPRVLQELAFKKRQKMTTEMPPEELITDQIGGEALNIPREVVSGVESGVNMVEDLQTVPLLLEIGKKEQNVKEDVLEKMIADVVTRDVHKESECEVEVVRRLKVEVFGTMMGAKNTDHEVKSGVNVVEDLQTLPLLAEIGKKEPQHKDYLEEVIIADVVTKDVHEKPPCDVEVLKQLNVEALGPMMGDKTADRVESGVNVVEDLQTTSLLVEIGKKEQKVKEDVLEKVEVADVVTRDFHKESKCEVELVRQLKVEIFGTMMGDKTTDHELKSSVNVVEDLQAIPLLVESIKEEAKYEEVLEEVIVPDDLEVKQLNVEVFSSTMEAKSTEHEIESGVNAVKDFQTVHLLVEDTKKEEKVKDKVLEKIIVADVLTKDAHKEPPCNYGGGKQLNVKVSGTMMGDKITDKIESGVKAVKDLQTIPLLVEDTKKGSKYEENVLEEVIVADVLEGKQLNIEVFSSMMEAKTTDHEIESGVNLVEDTKKKQKVKDKVLEKLVVADVVTKDTQREPPCVAVGGKELNVEVFGSVLKAETPNQDSTPHRKLLEKTFLTEVVYQLHVASETSSTLTKTNPGAPSEGPAAALNFPPLPEDQILLTGDPEMDPDVQKTWSDSSEG